ncbi:MAG: hypothetical protein WCE21_00810 [Candidatus Babeliales bacterium]
MKRIILFCGVFFTTLHVQAAYRSHIASDSIVFLERAIKTDNIAAIKKNQPFLATLSQRQLRHLIDLSAEHIAYNTGDISIHQKDERILALLLAAFILPPHFVLYLGTEGFLPLMALFITGDALVATSALCAIGMSVHAPYMWRAMLAVPMAIATITWSITIPLTFTWLAAATGFVAGISLLSVIAAVVYGITVYSNRVWDYWMYDDMSAQEIHTLLLFCLVKRIESMPSDLTL